MYGYEPYHWSNWWSERKHSWLWQKRKIENNKTVFFFWEVYLVKVSDCYLFYFFVLLLASMVNFWRIHLGTSLDETTFQVAILCIVWIILVPTPRHWRKETLGRNAVLMFPISISTIRDGKVSTQYQVDRKWNFRKKTWWNLLLYQHSEQLYYGLRNKMDKDILCTLCEFSIFQSDRKQR